MSDEAPTERHKAMKLVISAHGRKRELRAPFDVCASVDDLKALERAIHEAILIAEDHGSTYGWLLKITEEGSTNVPVGPAEAWA